MSDIQEQTVKILVSKIASQRNKAMDQLAQCETALDEERIKVDSLIGQLTDLKIKLSEFTKAEKSEQS